MGIDPGLTRCGIGVIDAYRNRTAELVAVGVEGTSSDRPLEKRLLHLAERFRVWMEAHRPDVVSIERVFTQTNVSTAMGTAQASGIAMVEAARLGIPVALHTPTEVKAAVAGTGSANKEAIARTVVRVLKLSKAPTPADAADSLAIALTHAWRMAPVPLDGSEGRTAAQRAWVEAERRAARSKRS